MIKRTILKDLIEHLNQKEITLITGPRQAGKTTIMKQMQEHLENISKKSLFLSLDNESDRVFFESQQLLLQKIALEIGEKGYVFIDEIQRKENAGVYLKGLYDMELPYKFIVSGSGSLELKERIHESLVGRKQLFEIGTLSFEEFCDYKLEYRYSDRLMQYISLHPAQYSTLFGEYMSYGGYPRVVLADTDEKKRHIIADIYQSYLEKDIAYLLQIQKTEKLTHLVRILASRPGGLVNSSELSSTIGISVQTVAQYMWYLEKTFIIRRITPYFTNIRKELSKMGKVCFVDLGLCRYAQGQFGTAIPNDQYGLLFENAVHNEILAKLSEPQNTIHYWRTHNKTEVDFVVRTQSEIIPVEVKYRDIVRLEMTRSFRSFLNSYRPKRAFIVHQGKTFEEVVSGTHVIFISFAQLATIEQSNSQFA